MPEAENDLEYSRNLRARNAALAAAEKVPVTPTGIVTYRSRGRVLVIGGEAAQWLAARLEAPLRAEVLSTDAGDEPGVPMTPLAERTLTIDGHLGAFRVELGERGKHNHQVLDADLVVDLGDRPLIGSELPPPGYWHFGTDPEQLDAAWLALDGMVGTFEKPRYFAYEPDFCAHGRAGVTACTRCIDACPADAIVSLGEQVQVNPNLCQGGGVCATVCPSGAMRYAYPGVDDTLTRLRRMLRVYREEGGVDPELVVYTEADADPAPLQASNRLPLLVEELASVGLDVWLSALAYGVRVVLLVKGDNIPPGVTRALDDQLAVARDILQALGYPSTAIGFVGSGAEAPTGLDPMPPIEPAAHSGAGAKRDTLYLAIDHLYEQAQRPKLMATLNVGAPFGTAAVSGDACTLCLACVGACPGKALQSGDGQPQLKFIEANCLQCGMCTRTCPEDAIWISPRLLFSREDRGKQRILHEDPPILCVSCGKPFATRKVLDTIIGKLAGHPMFQTERALQRLRMCEDCRVVDAVQDAEAMQAGLTGISNQSIGRGRS
jgi:ferredoxin